MSFRNKLRSLIFFPLRWKYRKINFYIGSMLKKENFSVFNIATSMDNNIQILPHQYEKTFSQVFNENNIIHDEYVYVPLKKYSVSKKIQYLVKNGFKECSIKFNNLNKGKSHSIDEEKYKNAILNFENFRYEKAFEFLTPGDKLCENNELFFLLKNRFNLTIDNFYEDFKESEIGWGANNKKINYCSQSLFHWFYTNIIFKNIRNISRYKNLRIFEVGPGFGGLIRSIMNYINKQELDIKVSYYNFDMEYVQNLFTWFSMKDQILKESIFKRKLKINILSNDKNFKFPKKQNDTADLFIATHSMTELDYSNINFYWNNLNVKCDYSLIAYVRNSYKNLNMDWIPNQLSLDNKKILLHELTEGGKVSNIFSSKR